MSFVLSCFADEIDSDLSVQMREMRRCGIGHLELRGVGGRNVSEFSEQELREIKKRLDGEDIRVSAIGSPVGKIGIKDDFAPHLAVFERMLGAAQIMGARYIRIFSFYMPKGEDAQQYFEPVCERLEKFKEKAIPLNLVLLHENEKGIFGDIAPRCKQLMERLGDENFKMTFDPANFVQCGQKVMEAYRLLVKYIEYVHIKDAKFADASVVPAGYGDGEIKEMLAALYENSYDGFLSLEPHLGDFKGFSALEQDKKELNFSGGTDAVGRFELAVNCLRDAMKKVINA